MGRQTAETRGKFLFGRNPRHKTEKPTSKEDSPGSIIKQVSFAIACIEEGPHITRVIKQLTKVQEIPSTTDILIAISDNGSRGAWTLIEGASTLQKMQDELEKSLNPHQVSDFHQLTTIQKKVRKLQYQTVQSPTDVTLQNEKVLAEQDLAYVSEKLLDTTHGEQNPLLQHFLIGESYYRSDLLLAMASPEVFIKQTDANPLHPRLIPNQEPTFWQKETIRIYAEMFSGKYDKLPHNIRIKLATGSEQGNFGSVEEVAR